MLLSRISDRVATLLLVPVPDLARESLVGKSPSSSEVLLLPASGRVGAHGHCGATGPGAIAAPLASPTGRAGFAGLRGRGGASSAAVAVPAEAAIGGGSTRTRA